MRRTCLEIDLDSDVLRFQDPMPATRPDRDRSPETTGREACGQLV
jgi:hypothetical protein